MIGGPARCGRSDRGRIPVMIGGLAHGGLATRPGLTGPRGLAVRAPAGRWPLAGRPTRGPVRGIRVRPRPLAGRLGRPVRGLGVVGVGGGRLNVLAGRHMHDRARRGLDVVGVQVRRLNVLAGTRLHGRPPPDPGSIEPGATGTRRFRRRPTRPRICCRRYRQQPRTLTPCAHGSSPPRRHIAMTRPDRQSGTIRPELSRNRQIARSRWRRPPVDGTPQCPAGSARPLFPP